MHMHTHTLVHIPTGMDAQNHQCAHARMLQAVVAALAVEPCGIPTLMNVKDCLDYCSSNWVTLFGLLEGPQLLMRAFRTHWAGARQAGGVDAVEHLEAALQVRMPGWAVGRGACVCACVCVMSLSVCVVWMVCMGVSVCMCAHVRGQCG